MLGLRAIPQKGLDAYEYMMKNIRMDIVAYTDNRFVMPTGVMMQSACVNNPDVDIVK